MNLHQLREEEYALFPSVIRPSHLSKRTSLTTKTGVQKLVELDRYSLRDNTLQTLKEGDVIIAELVFDPKYPVQGYGRVKTINRENNTVTMHVEYPEVLFGKDGAPLEVDLENFERPLNKVIKPLEVYWEQIAYRVARGTSSVEKSRGLRRYWFKKFFNELKAYNGIPGGRILYGAGSGNNVTLFNCFVLGAIPDSRKGINDHRGTTMEIMSRGGGVGSNGSALRPKDEIVVGVNGKSSGSVSWLNDLSKLTDLVQQGGCVAPYEKVLTSKGWRTVEDIYKDPSPTLVQTHKGLKPITAKFDNGVKKVFKVTTEHGYTLDASEDHKFGVFQNDGTLKLIPLKDLKEGDEISILLGDTNSFSTDYIKLDTSASVTTKSKFTTTEPNLPKYLTEDLAFVLGYFLANGYVIKRDDKETMKGFSLSIPTDRPTEFTKLSETIAEIFGVSISVYNGEGAWRNLNVYSTILMRYFSDNGFVKSKSSDVEIPELVLNSPRSVLEAYIGGLFAGDGSNKGTKGGLSYTTTSRKLTRQYQSVLLQLGVASNLHIDERLDHDKWQPLYVVSVNGKTFMNRFSDILEGYTTKIYDKEFSIKESSFSFPFNLYERFKHIPSVKKSIGSNAKRTSLKAISNLIASYDVLEPEDKDLVDLLSNTVSTPIKSIDFIEDMNVYDFEVQDVHMLSFNGAYTSNSRRGAQMIGLADWHPDLVYFIMCKIQNPHVLHKIATESSNEIISHTAESLLIRDGKGNPIGVQDTSFMTGANISILTSDDFMRQVESDGDWSLRFPDIEALTPKQKEYYDTEWHKLTDVRKWEELGYPTKVYSTFKAQELWDLINVAARFSAEPGIIFIDTCNNESNCWYYSPLVVTNPCFTGDMRLLTSEGYKTFEELEGTEFEVVNHLGDISKGKVWKSGDKNTVEIKFYGVDKTIRCTPDHRFMLIDGSACEAQHLAGKRIMPFFQHKETQDDLYVKLGFIQGDGSLTRLHSEHRHKGLEINLGVNDNDVRTLFGYEVDGERKVYTTEFTDLLLELGFSSAILPERGLPTTITTWTREQKRAFLKGLYSANGSVINTGRVSFKTTSVKLKEQLQELLLEFGIPTVISINKPKDVEFDNGVYTCRESFDININKHKDRITFFNEIGFLQEYKMDKLKFNLIESSPTVKTVKATGKVEAVYDFHEPETHWGVVEGKVAHNCGEQPLPPYAVCNLFAINLANFYDANGHKVDYPRLRRTLRVAHRFADNIIDHSFYFLAENEKMAKAERRIGLGVMGLADLLIFLKQAYGSEESLETIDELFAFIRDEVYLASTEVAEEKGSFEYFNSEKFLQSGFVKRLPPHILGAIKKKGIRNVCNLTVAPTGSTGTMVGVSTGLEPYFAFKYYRSGRLGKFIEVNTDIAQAFFDANPEATELPDYYVASNDLPALLHVKVQSTIQKYIDSAISKTANAPSTFTVEDNKELYLEAWRTGCKGVTVYVDGSRDSQVLNLTKDDNEFESLDETVIDTVEGVSDVKELILFAPSDSDANLEAEDTRACQIRFENGQMIKEC